MIRTLNTKARSMLLDANLPKRFWAEAISTALYLHRRSPSNSFEGFSPYERLTGSKPKLHHLRRFGCTVYKHIPKQQQKDGKFGSHSKPCMFLGYVHKTTKIWRIWDFKGGPRGQGGAVECFSVVFKENENAYTADHSEDTEVSESPFKDIENGDLEDSNQPGTGPEVDTEIDTINDKALNKDL